MRKVLKRSTPSGGEAVRRAARRADFDEVFDRYVDAIWAGLVQHASEPDAQKALEGIMTQIVLRWHDGLPLPALDVLALDLLQREQEAARRPPAPSRAPRSRSSA